MPNRALLSVATLALLVGPVACTTSGSKASPDASGSATPANAAIAPSASVHNQHMRRERNGAAGMLFHAARDLQLSDTQSAALDDLENKLEQSDGPPVELRTFQTDLVAGIRAGKMDKAKIQTDFAALDAASTAHDAKEAYAIAGLWAALDPAQRTQLTTAVRAKEEQREAMIAAHTPNPDAGVGFDAGAIDWSKKRLEKMTAQLGLDANQQKSVAAILPKEDWMNPSVMKAQREEGKKRVDAILAAFAAPTFDANKLDLSGPPGKKREGLEKDASFLGQLVPILTQEQRDKLAAQREHMGMRRGGMGGGGPESHFGQPGMP